MKKILIADECIVNVWQSVNNPKKGAEVNPDWYVENGIPIDEEGDDMVYTHSYIVPNGGDFFADTLNKINQWWANKIASGYKKKEKGE